MASKTPRGIRNNNPLNIRIGNTWLGEVPKPTDSDFEQFVSVEYGLRAAFMILRRYIRRYGRNTPARIIRAWAPSTENNTRRYIDAVCERSNLLPDEVIRYEDRGKLVRLVSAMIVQECGQSIPEEKIIQGYKMA